MRDWLLLLRNVFGALAVMLGAAIVVGLGASGGRWLFAWAAVAGGLAIAQRDAAYQRGKARG